MMNERSRYNTMFAAPCIVTRLPKFLNRRIFKFFCLNNGSGRVGFLIILREFKQLTLLPAMFASFCTYHPFT